MINVVQILLGDCPPFIAKCMQTVKSFAERNAYNYTILSSVPSWYNGKTDYLSLRSLSEWMRLDLLAEEENILFVDWDIKLLETFSIPNDLTFASQLMDCMMYNHDRANFFKEARESISYLNRQDSTMIMHKAIINMLRKGFRYSTFNNYIHYEYSCNREFYETN